MNIVETSGPMELTISGIQLATLELSEEYMEFFEDEEYTLVGVEMKAENTSEDDISFYPDQAVLTTDVGDQVDAEMLLSDDVGGDFFGPTNKKGAIYFLFHTDPSEINSVKLIIDGAHDDDFERVGDDLKIDLEF